MMIMELNMMLIWKTGMNNLKTKTKTMNDRILEREVNNILDKVNEVVVDLVVYAENLEREIDKLEETIKDMADRITELEESFLELNKP
jgi:predicted  nucleic acid-binding Zn-ribbon protein